MITSFLRLNAPTCHRGGYNAHVKTSSAATPEENNKRQIKKNISYGKKRNVPKPRSYGIPPPTHTHCFTKNSIGVGKPRAKRARISLHPNFELPFPRFSDNAIPLPTLPSRIVSPESHEGQEAPRRANASLFFA